MSEPSSGQPAETAATPPAPVTPPAPETAPAPVAPAPIPTVPDRPPTDPARRAFLAVSGMLLFGWFAWLGYAALNKSREPLVSRSQAAVAPVPVRATVTADQGAPGTKAVVVESLKPGGPPANATLLVTNLPTARGFSGDGEYLLLLDRDHLASLDGAAAYRLIGPLTSATEAEPPTIYRWTPDVAAQAKRLFSGKD